jgi:hypothetical protein
MKRQRGKIHTRLLIAVSLPLFLIVPSIAASEGTNAANGFRKATWGMSKAQVKATESGKIYKEDDERLCYQGTVGEKDTLIMFVFAEGELVRGRYAFLTQHTNKNAYIDDFKELKGTLTEKYGQPSKDNVIWGNDLYKDEPSEWGTAVSIGHLSYFTSWDVGDTEIILGLYGDNFQIHMLIEYSSKSLADLASEAKRKKDASEF